MNKIDWVKWSAIADVLGAIAVVITLLYLSLQTKYLATQTEQNTAAIRASVRQSMFTNDQTAIFKNMDQLSCQIDPSSRGWSNSGCAALSTLVFLRSRENNWLQYHDGVIDDVTWESYNKALISTLSDPEIVDRWAIVRGQLSDGFGKYVDQLRADIANGSLGRSSGRDANQ